MGLAIITFAGYVLLLLLNFADTSSNRRCFPLYGGGSMCFIRPDPPVALSWFDAQQWCSNIGATLPIPDTYSHNIVYGNALGYFGLMSKTMYLGANSTFDLNDWYWTNGTRFTDKIEHGNNTLKTHAYIIRNGTDIKFVAADPRFAQAGSICQSASWYKNERACSITLNSYWSNDRCFIKIKHIYNWNTYLSYCGGLKNLPLLEDLNEMSQWIDDQAKFWIGLRCTWWTWQDMVSGNSFELSESQFGRNFPNNTSPECLASYDGSYGDMYWMNQNCSKELQFICQQYVDPTTTTKTTMSTHTTTRRPSSVTTRISATTMNSTSSNASSATPRPKDATHVDFVPRQSATTPISSVSTTSNFPTVFRVSEVAGTSSLTAQLGKIPPSPIESDEDILNKYGLVVLLAVGLCVVLSLAGIIWLAALTARVSKINRYSSKTLPKQHIEHLQLTCSNPYEISTFDNTHALKEEGHSFAVGGAEKSSEEL